VVQNLINEMQASSLTGTQKNGLLAKLNAALQGINNGQRNVACNIQQLGSEFDDYGNLTASARQRLDLFV
jgi:hypothetical protein